MRGKVLVVAAALVAAFLPLVAAQDLGPLSPDGVALLDFDSDSRVWVRSFSIDWPEGITPGQIFYYCHPLALASGGELGFIECVKPLITDVWWTDEAGNRVGPADPGLGDPAQAFSGTHGFTVTAETFQILDDVDPDSAAAEPYIVVRYIDGSGAFQNPRVDCADWGVSAGFCGASVTANALYELVCTLEFWTLVQ